MNFDLSLWLCAAWVVLTALATHEAYKWGLSEGREETYAHVNKMMFRAVRETCADPTATQERRTGAYHVVRKAVRR